MAARRYDPEATRQAILDAAKDVFVERGVAETAVSEIAAAAGVTKSLIHHHFGSKEELWNEVKRANFKRYFEPILASIRSGASDGDTLEAVITHMFTFLRDNPDVARLMGWMALEQDTVNTDLMNEVCVEGLQRIEQGQKEGALRPDVHPASIMSTFIILTSNWWHFRHHIERWRAAAGVPPLPGNEEMDDVFLRDFLKLFMRGTQPT